MASDYKTEFDETYKGYRMVGRLIDPFPTERQSKVAETLKLQLKWRCGYVALPAGHEWYGKDFNDIPIECHGKLSFSSENNDLDEGRFDDDKNMYWIGFDCMHAYDTLETCTTQFVREECQRIINQLDGFDRLEDA